VMQREVRRMWEEGKEKRKKKVDFLEKEWRRKRQDLWLGEKEVMGVLGAACKEV
jgi:hypothetical protein